MRRTSKCSGSWFLKPHTVIFVMLLLVAFTQQSSAQLANNDDPFNENIQVCASLDRPFKQISTRQESMSFEGGPRHFHSCDNAQGHYARMNQPSHLSFQKGTQHLEGTFHLPHRDHCSVQVQPMRVLPAEGQRPCLASTCVRRSHAAGDLS